MGEMMATEPAKLTKTETPIKLKRLVQCAILDLTWASIATVVAIRFEPSSSVWGINK